MATSRLLLADASDMTHYAELIKAIGHVLWPILALCTLLFLLPVIRAWLPGASEVEVEVAGFKFRASAETNALLIQPVLAELDDAVSSLAPIEKQLCCQILRDIESGKGYVIPAGFARNSDMHE